MKKLTLFAFVAALMMISSAAFAQTTASGTLTVTATAPSAWFSILTGRRCSFRLAQRATLAGTVQAFGGALTAASPAASL
jgi:hypothetical protein